MQEIKRCKMCGVVISTIETDDWYRHIRIQYCAECGKHREREKTAARVAALRERKREKDKYRDEQLELLKQENELLRKRIEYQRELLQQDQQRT